MAFVAKVIRLFLASPGDIAEDRDVARRAIDRWNVKHAVHEAVVLLAVGWETDAIPEWGDHPQAALNRQLVDPCDVLLGVFWTRLGTPTAEGRSGTVEEIERFAATGKPVLLYFCRKHTDPGEIDPTQLDALRAFESECRDRALYDSYSDAAEFEQKLDRALTRIVRDHFSGSADDGDDLPRGRRLEGPPRTKQGARLTAHLEKHGRNTHRLVVANSGTLDVLGLDVEVPEEVRSFSLLTSELPIDVLRSGERAALLASVHMGGGPSIFDVYLTGKTRGGEIVRFPSKISI